MEAPAAPPPDADLVPGGELQGTREQAAQAPMPQEAHRPLLRVDRTEGITAERHFLLPVDDTEDSEVAIKWAVEHLYRDGDVFHLLHVIPEPQMVHIWGGVYVPPNDDAELMEVEDTKDFVRHRFARALIAAKVPFQLHVIVGPTDTESVARLIVKKADALPAAGIVMSRHSKGRLKEMWVGSVTKATVKWAMVPVAVVPHV